MTPTITRVDLVEDSEVRTALTPSETTTLTVPLSPREIGMAISGVIARRDEEYAIDLVTMLQVQARRSEDTGERISLADFASQEGFDLAQLRSE